MQPGAIRISDFQPVLDALELGDRMPGLLQTIGLTLGGRFDLPPNSCLVAFGEDSEGYPEFELYVMLGNESNEILSCRWSCSFTLGNSSNETLSCSLPFSFLIQFQLCT